jgi:tetratricopeptide (TPR) repeat protein
LQERRCVGDHVEEKEEAVLSLAKAALFAVTFFVAGGVCARVAQTQDDIARAIRQLGDQNFAVREKALMFLWSAGSAAEPALQAALKSGDAEVATRARSILEGFKYGIYPDTPPHIVDLVQQFRAGDSAKKEASVKKLFALGSLGQAVVLKLAAAEDNRSFRTTLFQQIVKETPRISGDLLAEDKLNAVEELLERTALHPETGSGLDPYNPTIRNYAALLVLRGTLDKKIAELSLPPETVHGRRAEVLAYLHRAKGDLPAAFRAAELAKDRPLQRWLLWEQSKWEDLLELHPPRTDMKGRPDIQILGHQAACQRLAGQTKDFEKTVAEIRRYADAKKGDPHEASMSAIALFLNDRPQDAIDLYIQAKSYGSAFGYLKDQMRYREAFALADKVKGAGEGETHKEAFLLESRRACTLYELGEKEKALPLLAKLGDAIKNSTADDWVFGYLVGSEHELGLKDLAFEHAALTFRRPKFSNPGYLFYRLFGDKSSGADMWWSFLRRKFPAEDHLATMKRLRSIMEGTLDRKEFITLAQAAADWTPEPRELRNQQREGWLGALGEACLGAGLEKEAHLYFEDAIKVTGGRVPLLRLADFLAKKKQWHQAAALYGQAWEKDKQAHVPLFLQGWALVQAGQKTQGEKLIKLAHWLPLANMESRYLLAQAMTKRGLNDQTLREWELSARIGDVGDLYTYIARQQLGDVAAEKGRFLEAAGQWELHMLYCLGNAAFVESSSYLDVPHYIHRDRAQGLLAAGKTKEALKEIQICLVILPADVDTAILLAPALEKAGRKQDADELFDKVFAQWEQHVTDYPRWARGRNLLAWLCARCRRNLDKALTHAQKAVELHPKSATYLDTLAEVHFQRADQARAIELMRRCIDLDPQREFFRGQLKRFQAGNRLADIPR